MKKILILVSFLILTTISAQSQTYSFVLDTVQPFRCPSNLDVNTAAKLNKFEYFEYYVFPKNVWKIDLGKKVFTVGKKIIKIVGGNYDNKDGWVYIEFFDPNNNLHKLGIGNEKGTNKKIVIVTTLDDDVTIQKGYFGYPINYKINSSIQ
jgi:hypothetical protein